MSDLTGEDIEAIGRIIAKYGSRIMYECDEDLYRAGLAAGAKRENEACAALRKNWGRAHTYASENADSYRAFDAGLEAYLEAIRARRK